MLRAISGQFVYFDLASAISGNPVTGASGSISGRKATDAISGMIALSGNIIELGGGMYRANLYDFDTSGLYVGYYFTASGCVPRSFSVVTTDASSGRVYPASGVNAVVPPASLSGVVANSGLTVSVVKETISGVVANSGLFVTATASVASGSLYLASGSIFRNTFASGVIGSSGGFPQAWGNSGQTFPASGVTQAASGPFVNVPPATLSGVVANSGLFVSVPIATLSGTVGASGIFANVPPASLSGVVANSGLTVTVIKETISGVVANSGLNVVASTASGTLYLASGSIFRETYASGVFAASGGFTTAWGNSGQAFAASGANVVVPISSISGAVANSGLFVSVLPANLSGISVASGQVVNVFSGQLSGQLVTAASGVNAVVPIASISGVIANSGLFVTVVKETISGVVANSGLNVVATASIASGSLYLASGSLFRETFASGVIGSSGGFPQAWGKSGQVVPASGFNAVVPVATLSGMIANSGLFVAVPVATLSGVNIQSGAFVTAAALSGTLVNVFSGQLSGFQLTARTVSDKSGYVLGSTGLNFIWPESGSQAGNASGLDARQTLAIIGASAAGRLSGAGTATIRIDGAGVSGTVRIVATVDASGNRVSSIATPP